MCRNKARTQAAAMAAGHERESKKMRRELLRFVYVARGSELVLEVKMEWPSSACLAYL